MRLVARNHRIDFPRRPLVMGIVNLSADSFSGDGTPELHDAMNRARQHLLDGAEIIDIGAESARTNRGPIEEKVETGLLRSFIERWPELVAECNVKGCSPLLAINTWRPAVVREVLPYGGDILNDIGALPSDENARVCAQTGAALLIMHSVGEPKVPHTHVGYPDIMEELERFFESKLKTAELAGVPRDGIVLDPGIDFAKQRADNLRIYRELERLQHFGRPLLLPVSRKTVIGEVLGIPNAADRDAGTVACIVQGILRGAHIFRVHNVPAAVQTVKTVYAIETGEIDGIQPV